MPAKRPQLAVATACDGRAQVAVTVVELRGAAPRYWEHVDRGPTSSSAGRPLNQLNRVYEVARAEGLRDFVVRLSQKVRPGPHEVPSDLGDVRFRVMTRNNRGNAKQHAHVALRQLVPLPEKDDDTDSWADLGVELEIAAYARSASPDGREIPSDPWDPLLLVRDVAEQPHPGRSRRYGRQPGRRVGRAR